MDRPENLSLRDKIEWIIKELRKLKRGGGGSSSETNPGLGAVAYNNDYNSLSNKPDLSLKADKSTTYTKSEVDTKLEEAIYYSIIY